MITWEEALKTASERLKEIGSCTEFTTAYVFRGPEKEETIGGFAAPVVVMKENGRRCSCARERMGEAELWQNGKL